MIKIEIKNPDKFSEEYFKKISPHVISHLEFLHTSLSHLTEPKKVILPIRDFRNVSNMTKKLFGLLRGPKLPKVKFNGQKGYMKALLNNATKTKNASGADIQRVIALVKFLLDPLNGKLEALLRCAPVDLEKTNSILMAYLPKSVEKDIIKLVFDYSAVTKISEHIKAFFRGRNLVNYCPYCNQDPAMYSGLATGRTVRVHQLDHFYDKSSNPLLSYSVFNLIPGDWICNSINKHDTSFDSKHYLNPYLSGFGRYMVFVPHYDTASMDMSLIELEISKGTSDEVKKRLLGPSMVLDENYKMGNINTFALHSKYNLAHVREEAARVHRKFLNIFKNYSSNLGFLNQLPIHSMYDQYKFIYEEEIRSPFESSRFNEQRYSKMFRDIHDFILKQDSGRDIKILKDLSDNNY
jgi:hypothetical protein